MVEPGRVIPFARGNARGDQLLLGLRDERRLFLGRKQQRGRLDGRQKGSTSNEGSATQR